MASAIDETKPVSGTPTTQSVRDNFAAAKSEIEALQTAKADTTHNHDSEYIPISAPVLLTADIGTTVGYPNIPWNPQSADYTTTLSDAGKGILHPAADTTPRTWTINAALEYLDGTPISLRNQNSAGAITVTISGGTLRKVGTGTTGNFTLAANGLVTLIREGSEWAWNGVGAT